MNPIPIALAILLTAFTCLAQGKVNFANKVGTTIDQPVFLHGTQDGPGPGYTAQLFLQGPSGSLTPLTPASTFFPRGTAGNALFADRYWESKLVDVPVNPGTDATFVVRAWLTSFGSYDNTVNAGCPCYGQSDPFVLTVGGGAIPVPDLTTLKAFDIFIGPEPSTLTLGLLGAAVLVVFRRTR
jgi:hypothetical protein